MDDATFRMMFGASIWEAGQQEWTVPGTYQFTVPNIPYLSAVCVSGGQAGQPSAFGQAPEDGGFGGSLRYHRQIPVTPGEILTIVVGRGGQVAPGVADTLGGSTYIMRGSTVLLCAACVTGTVSSSPANTPGSSVVGGNNGGVGTPMRSGGYPGGGGGAGGYSGAGNTGTGGSGGQGYPTNGNPGLGGGGGVGINGEGASGANGTSTSPQGKGGSGGNTGSSFGDGGRFGGGGAGERPGADGACRIIWGPGREYPSTNTQNV